AGGRNVLDDHHDLGDFGPIGRPRQEERVTPADVVFAQPVIQVFLVEVPFAQGLLGTLLAGRVVELHLDVAVRLDGEAGLAGEEVQAAGQAGRLDAVVEQVLVIDDLVAPGSEQLGHGTGGRNVLVRRDRRQVDAARGEQQSAQYAAAQSDAQPASSAARNDPARC